MVQTCRLEPILPSPGVRTDQSGRLREAGSLVLAYDKNSVIDNANVADDNRPCWPGTF